MKKTTLLIALGLAVPGWAIAQSQMPSTAAPSNSASSPSSRGDAASKSALPAADLAFMRDAARAGTAEVQASQLALTRASDPAVKQFAQQMVQDHTQANAKLMQLAQSKGITLPTEPSTADANTLKSLQAQSGAQFDQHYMGEFGLKAHRSAVDKFRRESQSGQDSDIKSFAQQTLPTLEMHLQHAASMSPSSGTSGSTSR